MVAKKNNISEIATYRSTLKKSIAQMPQIERDEHYKSSVIRSRKFFQSGNRLCIKKMDILLLNMPIEK